MSNEESTTVKVTVFDGKEKNYQSWLMRFKAFARVKDSIVFCMMLVSYSRRMMSKN